MSKQPPIPPEQRSVHAAQADLDDQQAPNDSAAARQGVNPDRQGQAGNSKINTTHQGYQQDR